VEESEERFPPPEVVGVWGANRTREVGSGWECFWGGGWGWCLVGVELEVCG